MNMQLSIIEAISADIRDMLGDDFDADTFFDTLEGETNIMEVTDKILASMQDDAALVDGIKAQEALLKTRRERIQHRDTAKRKALLHILDAVGEKKMERPLATISRRTGSVSVLVTDETEIPTQLTVTKTVTSPDKKAIKAMLDAGEVVPGAELQRGDDTVTVRIV